MHDGATHNVRGLKNSMTCVSAGENDRIPRMASLSMDVIGGHGGVAGTSVGGRMPFAAFSGFPTQVEQFEEL